MKPVHTDDTWAWMIDGPSGTDIRFEYVPGRRVWFRTTRLLPGGWSSAQLLKHWPAVETKAEGVRVLRNLVRHLDPDAAHADDEDDDAT